MAKHPALVNWSQYIALRGITTMLQSIPPQQNLRAAAVIGSAFYHASPSRRNRAETNIALSFPDWPQSRVRDVAERSMQHMFQMFLVDSLVTTRLITRSSWPRHIRLHPSIGQVMERLIRGEPMILLTGHCGNWEILGHFLALMGYPLLALARPLDNPLVNRWLLKQREAAGTRVLTKWGATPILQETLQAGGRVGFIADQNAGDGGMFVPFFGRLASSYKSIALLAAKYEVPIVAGLARRMGGRMEYELSCTDLIEPQDWVDQSDPLYYITARYNRAMEQMIQQAPEQYLWVHRRWKSRPKYERESKPMPLRLRMKIADLPWMTSAELEQLVSYAHPPAARRKQSH